LRDHLRDLGDDIDHVVALIEEYVPPSVRKVSCDGLVANGKFVPWAISDNVYRTDHAEVFDSLICPTVKLTAEEQQACNRRLELVARSLHGRFGLDNQFICVEMFVFDADRVEVMEVNGRISANQMPAFARCFDDGDPLDAMIALQTGKQPPRPRANGLYGVTLYRPTIADAPEVLINADGDLIYYRRQARDCHLYSFAGDSETARSAGIAWYEQLRAAYGAV
jgi:hypothetical protein